jgi:hypothetical protein
MLLLPVLLKAPSVIFLHKFTTLDPDSSGDVRRMQNGQIRLEKSCTGGFMLNKNRLISKVTFCALSLLIFGIGCSEVFSNAPEGSFLGRAGLDDYSPTAIQIGNIQHVFWCGQGHNPQDDSQDTDTILYATYNVATKAKSEPTVVMAETAGSWDSAYTCNPKVIGGVFTNPLGDGQTYSYALYYVATASVAGVGNAIGVAFSNDFIHWKKYPQPVIAATTQAYYGVGQPALYNSDGKSGIWLFYENLAGQTNGHFQATSTDGIHFKTIGELTTNGLQNDLLDVTWGDMAYDAAIGDWYAAFNMPRRFPSSTGGVTELGQMGVALYRISGGSLLSGATPWQRVATFDTVSTGHEANFIAGFLRDIYGNINVGAYPNIQLFTSISNPASPWDASALAAGQSGDPNTWDIGSVQWVPSTPLLPLNQYGNKSAQEATTGWIDPKGGFKLQTVEGQLYSGPQQGATVAVYGCKTGSTDYFISTDSTCGGSLVIGVNGYAFPSASAGFGLIPLYSCNEKQKHFVSKHSTCEGRGAGALVGYIKQ